MLTQSLIDHSYTVGQWNAGVLHELHEYVIFNDFKKKSIPHIQPFAFGQLDIAVTDVYFDLESDIALTAIDTNESLFVQT